MTRSSGSNEPNITYSASELCSNTMREASVLANSLVGAPILGALMVPTIYNILRVSGMDYTSTFFDFTYPSISFYPLLLCDNYTPPSSIFEVSTWFFGYFNLPSTSKYSAQKIPHRLVDVKI
jgi:hypothetical protein